jgi:alpha-L-fucosidase
MKVNGAAIYGTTASPFPSQLLFGRATSKPGKIYLHVFDWPVDGKLQIPALGKRVSRAYLLAEPKSPLTIVEGSNGLTIQLPGKARDPIATVIVLENR